MKTRSLLVSVATTALDLTAFAICVAFAHGAWMTLVIARWMCAVLGAGCNFALNRKLAFRDHAGSASDQLKRYAIVALGAVTLATCVWSMLRVMTGLDARLLHPLSAAIVWLVFTYPLLRRWVFSTPA